MGSPTDRAAVESYRGMCTLLTSPPGASYPGILVGSPGPLWREVVIVSEERQTVVALGGEKIYANSPREE